MYSGEYDVCDVTLSVYAVEKDRGSIFTAIWKPCSNQPVSVCSELELCGITTGGGLLLGVAILAVTSFGVREVGVVGLWLLPPTTPAYPEMGGGVTGGMTSFVV